MHWLLALFLVTLVSGFTAPHASAQALACETDTTFTDSVRVFTVTTLPTPLIPGSSINCTSPGKEEGRFCFDYPANPVACGLSTTITAGETTDLSASFPIGAGSASVGTRYSLTQSFLYSSGPCDEVKAVACYDNQVARLDSCVTTMIFGVFSVAFIFLEREVFGPTTLPTLIAKCDRLNSCNPGVCEGMSVCVNGPCSSSGAPGSQSQGTVTRATFNVDISDFFNPSLGIPPPDHPFSQQVSIFDDLTPTHLEMLLVTVEAFERELMVDIDEIAIFDSGGEVVILEPSELARSLPSLSPPSLIGLALVLGSLGVGVLAWLRVETKRATSV